MNTLEFKAELALKEAASAFFSTGLLILLPGILLAILAISTRSLPVCLVTGAVITPGVLFIVASVFLKRREPWAMQLATWLAVLSLVSSGLLLLLSLIFAWMFAISAACFGGAALRVYICLRNARIVIAQARAQGFDVMFPSAPMPIIAVQEEPGRPRPADQHTDRPTAQLTDRGRDAPALLANERSSASGER